MALILGDQMDRESSLFEQLDHGEDVILMAEVAGETEQVWNHKCRIALFLAAMRHFRDELRKKGYQVRYWELEEKGNPGSLGEALALAVREYRPERVLVVEPGEYRVREELQKVADREGVELEICEDRHFFTTPKDFAAHAAGRKQLRLEYFYRELRKRFGVLMEGGEPCGGEWNYDAENRESLPKTGPGRIPEPVRFLPDATTRGVLELVERKYAGHPGTLENFDWPVTPEEGYAALEDFLANRLGRFGVYQDAMWTGEPYLYHSRISSALNLKLIDPRRVCARAEEEYRAGRAPLAAVEGFIRQILGWREYVRGVYWHLMPEYGERNALAAMAPLPDFYWTGKTEMECLRQAIGQTLEYGYAHHIQRLMVTGLFALLLGVEPKQVHEWYLAVYVDAVEWVELPNTIGMSQFADGGVMASKPYVATGKYIQRMSNYCGQCRYDPAEAVGDKACPFTTLYWDFLLRHEEQLRGVGRMDMQLRNLTRLSEERKKSIRRQAQTLKNGLVPVEALRRV